MAGPRNRVETAETEAAAWHVRLGEAGVTPETLQAFFEWRQRPEHAEAYRRVELVWGQSARLAGDPEIGRVLDEARARRGRGRGGARAWTRRTWGPVAGVALVAAGLALAFGSWTWLDGRDVLTTGVGEQQLVQLEDGSSVRLDTDTQVRVRFDGDQRLLELEKGQALFTVAHDAGRPFVVMAGEARVTALGTVFDVRRKATGASVTLVSGVVAVGPVGREPRRMSAGHKAEVTPTGAVTRPVDTGLETGWTEGRIEFRDTPLDEAVAEVNRYLTDKITLDAGVPKEVAVNGVFRTGDREAFVSAASDVLDLEVVRAPGGAVRLSERGK